MQSQISIMMGSDIKSNGEIVDFFPVNMQPVVNEHGISGGYLSSVEGVRLFSEGGMPYGSDKGGYYWNEKLYRVIGKHLVSFDKNGNIDNAIVLGVSSEGNHAIFSNSFNDLGICYAGSFFIYDGENLRKVYSEDIDNETILGMVWIDGYFLLCNESNIFITELVDSEKISSVNYIASEIDPDPIKGLVKFENSLHVMNEHSIEVFENTGRKKFPFERVSGGGVNVGPIGQHSFCVSFGGIVLLGRKRNEGIGLWFFSGGTVKKIGGRSVDLIIESYTMEELENVIIEPRSGNRVNCLYIHFPDQTLVFDADASGNIGKGVWFILKNPTDNTLPYPARNFVNCFDKWIVGDPNSGKVGEMVSNDPSVFGRYPEYEFRSGIVYNDGLGLVVSEVKLEYSIGAVSNTEKRIGCSSSIDCKKWTDKREIRFQLNDGSRKKMSWLRQGLIKNRRVYRFTGSTDIPLKILRMDISTESMYR